MKIKYTKFISEGYTVIYAAKKRSPIAFLHKRAGVPDMGSEPHYNKRTKEQQGLYSTKDRTKVRTRRW